MSACSALRLSKAIARNGFTVAFATPRQSSSAGVVHTSGAAYGLGDKAVKERVRLFDARCAGRTDIRCIRFSRTRLVQAARCAGGTDLSRAGWKERFLKHGSLLTSVASTTSGPTKPSTCNVLRSDTVLRHGPIKACRTSNIPSMTGLPPSPPAGASASIGRRSISARCSPARPSESNKPTSGFGSSALWIMISDISTTRPAGSNPLQIPSGQKCYLCRRYEP